MKPIFIAFIILGYFSVLLFVGWITSRKASNFGFFLGGKKSPWYIVAIGMIGASISGVTFISVPGWVGTSQFSYMQMVLGYLLGYLVIGTILMPLYYRLNLTSIYTYLEQRFGRWSYKTGAAFFLLSRTMGSAIRLYLVAGVLHVAVFSVWHIPFAITVIVTILFIWLYTFKGGIKTIIWTDTLQALLFIASLILCVITLGKALQLSPSGIVTAIQDSPLSRIFFFDEWGGKHFIQQFLGGAFIAIVMTGLDQDMMQKNLSCRNIREAQKNMFWFSLALIPVNLLFMSLGVLLYMFAAAKNIPLPVRTDDLFPLIATQGYLPPAITVVFMLGLIAAAFSSADSALTALTTSFTIDILDGGKLSDEKLRATRKKVHFGVSLVVLVVILVFRLINNQAVVDAVFTIAGYTYGPLLGLFAFGLFTRKSIRDHWVPLVAILSPILSYGAGYLLGYLFPGYKLGYELILINGSFTFLGLWIISHRMRVTG
ncbi:MAG: sodium:solute symporter [Bacteroidales bacterium]